MCFDSRNRANSTSTNRIRGWTRFVLVLVVANACHAWGPYPVETTTPATGRLQGHFRVTVRDGSSVEMKDVLISSDSITGMRDTREVERVAVPRSQVIAFERQSFSASRTSYFLVASAAGAVVLFYIFLYWAMSQPGY